MKRLLVIVIVATLSTTLFSQTTQSEYNFLTKDYAAQMAKGIVPELDGYYLEDLLELTDKTGKVKLLYKNDQEDIVPVATQIQIYDGDRTFYICVPNEGSTDDIFTQHSDDIQNVFRTSTNAQSIFSIVMVQYPIELQRYYDEIRALEKAYAMENELENKGSNVVFEDDVNINSNPSSGAADNGDVKIVTEQPKENIVINEYNTNSKASSAEGNAMQAVGGGLSRRQLKKRPALYNDTKKTGKVRMNVCVNADGKVIRTSFNKDASTTKDDALVELATKFAKLYKFNKSSQSRQCGYVVFEFK